MCVPEFLDGVPHSRLVLVCARSSSFVREADGFIPAVDFVRIMKQSNVSAFATSKNFPLCGHRHKQCRHEEYLLDPASNGPAVHYMVNVDGGTANRPPAARPPATGSNTILAF